MKFFAFCSLLPVIISVEARGRCRNGADRNLFVVWTKLGCLTGEVVRLGRTDDDLGMAFRGVPYARAPVGDLRFKVPDYRTGVETE